MSLASGMAWAPARGEGISPAILLAMIPAAAIIGLLAVMFWISFRTEVTGGAWTLANYRTVFLDDFALRAMLNTLQFAGIALAVALVIGLFLAWTVERTDFGGGRFVYAALTLGILIPGFFTAMGWLFLMHPRSGIVPGLVLAWTGAPLAGVNIISPVGMGLVQGLTLAPVVFVISIAAFRGIDASLEEAASMSGGDALSAARRITLPLLLPAIAGAALYVFVIGFSAFDVPAVIGLAGRVYTFSTYLAARINPGEGLPQYGVAGAFSVAMVIFALIVSWFYSRILARGRAYQVLGGKSWRSGRAALRGWRPLVWALVLLYVLLAQLLPFAVLIWTALLPFLQPPSLAALGSVSLNNFSILPWTLILNGAKHSMLIALIAPALAMGASLLFSWVVLRTRSRHRFAFDAIAFLPHAVPGIVFGLAAGVASLSFSRVAFDIHGALGVLIAVQALTQISFGTRITNAALLQVNAELDEAAAMAGANAWTTAWRIIAPLLRPAIVYGWLWLAMLSIRELTLGAVLVSNDNMTFAVAIFTLLSTGESGLAAAAAILMMGFMLPFVALFLMFAGDAPDNANARGGAV